MESSARGGEQREDKGARKPAHIHRSLTREAPDRGGAPAREAPGGGGAPAREGETEGVGARGR